jgi:quercetin dioxygenase-like cupin family protein
MAETGVNSFLPMPGDLYSIEKVTQRTVMKNILVVAFLTLLLTAAAPASQPPGGKTAQLVRTTTSWNGALLPAYPAGQPQITILRITIPPKARLPIHEHPVINAGVLVTGELTVKTESGKTLHLKAGDPIVEVVNTWHYGFNPGNVPAEIIVFYAGVKGEPITIIKGARH